MGEATTDSIAAADSNLRAPSCAATARMTSQNLGLCPTTAGFAAPWSVDTGTLISYKIANVKPFFTSPSARANTDSRLVSRPAGRLMRAVLRLCSLMLVLQLSGAGPLVSALAGREEAGCSERCSDDDEPSGATCPPFCPNCTCIHSACPGLPGAISSTVGQECAPVAMLVAPLASSLHRNPYPAGIFRPPRD